MSGITTAEEGALYFARGKLAEFATQVGDKKFFDYSKDEIDGMIQNIVMNYQGELTRRLDDEIPF